jgi:hypothetical protein
VEWEYESVQEMRDAWAGWEAKPGAAAAMEEWQAIETGGGHGETWWLFAER